MCYISNYSKMSSCSLQRTLKLIQAVVGVSVIVLGVYNFFKGALDFQPVVLNIYFIFFGFILAITALVASASSLLHWFAFLNNWFGIGAYMVWLGCLCINEWNMAALQTWVGLVAVVTGFFCMIVHFATPGKVGGASAPLL